MFVLTRKGRPFIWGKEQQESFDKIKSWLIKPPVLHMPNKTGRFHLYSDNSKIETGSTLYQIQNGKPKLIAYMSKRLPKAVRIHKYLPKQTDIDKMLEIIQRKVLKGTHLPVEIKEIQAGYLHNSYFKDLYLYLSQNKLPSSKAEIKRVEAFAEKFILQDSLLFKINPEKKTVVLAVPEACVDKIITLSLKLVCRTSRSH